MAYDPLGREVSWFSALYTDAAIRTAGEVVRLFVQRRAQIRPLTSESMSSAEEPSELQPQQPLTRPITLDVGDVSPQVRTEARHLWAQELVRASLAIILLVILAVTVGWAFIGANGTSWPNYKELLELVLPAETALLGSAAGFYFGTRRD